MTVTQTTVGKTEADLEVHANSALRIALPWLDVAAIKHQLTFSFKMGHKTVEINGAKASSRRGRLDMLIESAGKRLAILELKKPGQPLDADDVDQGLSYARVLHPRPPIVIVSNGTDTRTYATETGELLKDGLPTEQAFAALMDAAMEIANSGRQDAIKTLMEPGSDVWMAAIRAATEQTLEELTGSWTDVRTPYAASRTNMGKSAIKSVRATGELVRSSVAIDGHLCPREAQISGTLGGSFSISDGLMVPNRQKRGRRAFLDGNFARRKLPLKKHEYCIWDTELAGFGLRIRPTGRYYWFVRLRHRGKHRRVSLGCTEDMDASLARSQARRLLAEVALDGLPKRAVVKATPTMTDYVETYWPDLARGWKPSTAKRNHNAWRLDLQEHFGECRVADVNRADVQRWRDGCIGDQEARFNRAIPVLGSLMKYAEALHLRRKNSNPCRGMPRYKREAKERYLTPLEYRRLAIELAEEEKTHPKQVAVVRMLIFTGARLSEIRDLQWDWVKPPRLTLPDSKTGPKTIWLNSQALAVLEATPKVVDCPFVFATENGTAPVSLNSWWPAFRRKCALPDVRIHDLRHSFASSAIMDHVPLATIGKLLGHALTDTTAKYAHLADDAIADAAQRVSGSLASALGLRA